MEALQIIAAYIFYSIWADGVLCIKSQKRHVVLVTDLVDSLFLASNLVIAAVFFV